MTLLKLQDYNQRKNILYHWENRYDENNFFTKIKITQVTVNKDIKGLRKIRSIEDYFIEDYSEYLRRNYDSIQQREGMHCIIAHWVNEQCEDLIV